jgi:hypothetical protein
MVGLFGWQPTRHSTTIRSAVLAYFQEATEKVFMLRLTSSKSDKCSLRIHYMRLTIYRFFPRDAST